MKRLETGKIETGNASTLAIISRLFIAVPIFLRPLIDFPSKMCYYIKRKAFLLESAEV